MPSPAGCPRVSHPSGRGWAWARALLLAALVMTLGRPIAPAAEENRSVRVGVDRNSPPLSFLDENGVLHGFTPELLASMAGVNGLRFEVVTASWKELSAAFEAGELDVLANITINDARRETMDFTIQHSYVHGITYTRPREHPLTHTSQFAGKRMASLHNSISDVDAVRHRGWGAEIVPYATWQEMLGAVVRGDCDFALIIRPLKFEQPDEMGLRRSFVEDIRYPFHMAVHRGDRRRLENLNEALATVRHNGTTDRLFAKWIGPIGPRPIRAVDLQPYLLPAAAVLAGVVLFMLWQRRINRTLQASEEKYRVLVDNTTEGIFVLQEHKFCFINPALLQMTGLRADQLLGRSIFDFIRPEEQATANTRQQELLEGARTASRLDYRAVLPDGRDLRLSVSSVRIDWRGRPATLSFATDVTAVRLAEQAREEAAQRLTKIADRVPGVVYQYRLRADGTTCFPYVSEGIRRIYGIDPGQVREDASPVYAALHPDDLDRVTESILVSAREFSPWHDEHRVVHRDGSVRWVRGNALPQKEPDGSVLWHGYIQDVTETKQAELALESERRRLADIINATNAATWEWNVQTGETKYNERWGSMLGYTPAELAPTTLDTWRSRIHPDDTAAAGMQAEEHLAGRRDHYECEVRLRHKAGHWIWVADTGQIIARDEHGRPLVMAGIHLDITERKQAEAAVRASLREKEALLKEVHHRVKNNLQVITSLLRLEAARHAEPQVKDVLREMQGRIRSMALLHETVYRADNVARVNLSIYLRQLTTQLFRAQNSPGERVRLKLDLTPVTVELDQAIPCGLIVNELVTNSLKHGFAGAQRGEVCVSLQPVGRGAVQLVVSDTGAGLPVDFDLEKTDSLGLRLVTDLARQIGGELQFAAGPSFMVTFTPRAVPRGSEPPFSTAV
ncbi:MAG: PAS domain-containing protein [Opitutaceae bacterium]|nr:PAS domain-containing protein [Opitutaceae bacterium]